MATDRHRPGVVGRSWSELRRRRALIAVAVLATGTSALIMSLMHDEVFEATTVLRLPGAALDEELRIAEGERVQGEVEQAFGAPVPSVIAERAGSELIRLSARGPSAATAAQVTNLYAESYLAVGLLSGAAVVEVADPPSTSIEPAPGRSTAIGLVAGLAIGLAAVAVARRSDPRRPTSAVDRALLVVPHPVLGTMAIDESDWPMAIESSDDTARRTRRVIAAVSAQRPRAQVIAFVGAQPGTAATRMAVHYARASARGTASMLVVDASIDAPALHRALGVTGARGLSHNLGGESLAMTVQPVGGRLSALAAGSVTGHPMAVLGSRRMEAIVAQMRSDHTSVAIVSPPVSAGGAAAALGRLADAVVLVVDASVTEDAVHDAIDSLVAANVPFVGVVFETEVDDTVAAPGPVGARE